MSSKIDIALLSFIRAQADNRHYAFDKVLTVQLL